MTTPTPNRTDTTTSAGAADPAVAAALQGEGAGARIAREVLSWPGVTAEPHRFGGVELQLGRRELGHLHGDGLADLPFPVKVREELVAAGRAELHHVLPDTGWVSYWIRRPEDVAGALDLFRLAYDRAVQSPRHADRAAVAETEASER